MFLFAKKNNEGKWIETDGKSAKLDKVLLKKEYLDNVPELQERDPDVLIVDENGVQEAPPIIDR